MLHSERRIAQWYNATTQEKTHTHTHLKGNGVSQNWKSHTWPGQPYRYKNIWAIQIKFDLICSTEELEDSVLSPLADNQTDPSELSSLAAVGLTSDLTASITLSDPDISPAEPSHLLTESTDTPVSLSESSGSPPTGALSFPMESTSPPTEPSVPAEDPPHKSPTHLLQSSAASELTVDTFPAEEDVEGPAEGTADPLHVAPAHQCSHESDEEKPGE